MPDGQRCSNFSRKRRQRNDRSDHVGERGFELLVPPFERVDSDEWASIVARAELTAPARRASS